MKTDVSPLPVRGEPLGGGHGAVPADPASGEARGRVASLPLTGPLMLASWPTHPVRAAAWGGFAYVTVFSMWLGFFAWYRGLALGGTVRVSQVQLVQPFAALLFAVPVLGERLDALTVGCSLAVIATVFVGKRMSVNNTVEPVRS